MGTASPVPGATRPDVRELVVQLLLMHAVPRLSGSDLIVAEAAPDEGSYQVPVIEGEELPDVPAADAAGADKESQMPAVEQPRAGAEVPRADQPPEVPQPGATP